MSLRDIWNKLYPDNLFRKDNESNFQKWLKAIAVVYDGIVEAKNQVKVNYILDNMDEEMCGIWEVILGLSENPLLTIENRRARIKAYLAGTKNTAKDVKDIVVNTLGVPYGVVTIFPRKDSMPSADITNNYTYDIIVIFSPFLVSYDPDELRRSIERVHPQHCILGDVYVFVGFLTLDTLGESLDDPDYVLAP